MQNVDNILEARSIIETVDLEVVSVQIILSYLWKPPLNLFLWRTDLEWMEGPDPGHVDPFHTRLGAIGLLLLSEHQCCRSTSRFFKSVGSSYTTFRQKTNIKP